MTPEKKKTYHKKWRNKNKEKQKIAWEKWYNKNKEKVAIYKIKYSYNITIEEYNNLLNIQNNICPICLEELGVPSRKIVIDHCHTTGKVRGIVHSKCNTGLGLFNEDVKRLRLAINYLEKHVDK